jgi:VanZ family protein
MLMRVVWCGWLLVVLVGTLLPANSAPLHELGRLALSDKSEHFLAYFVLASLLPFVGTWRWRRMLLWCAGLVALGFALEVAQAFAPGRSPDVWDGVAGTLGVMCGRRWDWLRARQPWRSVAPNPISERGIPLFFPLAPN